MEIFLNQIGYINDKPKIALINEKLSGETEFSVIENKSGNAVYRGKAVDIGFDEDSGYELSKLDFSTLVKDGEYFIKAGECVSPHFMISEKPYNMVKRAMMKAFYLQRCGTELYAEYAGVYKHKCCHNADAELINEAGEYENRARDVSGGWHDAGDYGRYTVPAATALGHILYAYDMFPEKLADGFNIPNHGTLPDILEECKYEYEWLLKMQSDEGYDKGGFYHKVATRYFCSMIMPEDDKDELLLFSVSSCATGAACAVMALGARIYEKLNPDFANLLRLSAENAWEWLIKNENRPFKNPSDVVSGEYGYRTDTDERFWAAVEMYRLTGKNEFIRFAKKLVPLIDATKFGWSMVGGFGALSYLIETKFSHNDAFSTELMSLFVKRADELIANVSASGFNSLLSTDGYRWGSCMGLLCGAMILITAKLSSEDEEKCSEYETAALYQLDYLLGRNATGYSFVSGFGAKPIQHPHHRPSVADGIPECVPGLVSGGPNLNMQDEYAKRYIDAKTPPARCFIDHDQSYSTNEVTIYWNSPAVFLAAYFD